MTYHGQIGSNTKKILTHLPVKALHCLGFFSIWLPEVKIFPSLFASKISFAQKKIFTISVVFFIDLYWNLYKRTYLLLWRAKNNISQAWRQLDLINDWKIVSSQPKVLNHLCMNFCLLLGFTKILVLRQMTLPEK